MMARFWFPEQRKPLERLPLKRYYDRLRGFTVRLIAHELTDELQQGLWMGARSRSEKSF